MRIAQVSPLYESVPPTLYGGTERVVAYLTEELVRQGHDVTLFASGDSETAAELVPCVPRALRLDPTVVDGLAHHVLQLERVAQRAREFDVIHYHVDYLHFPLSRRLHLPALTTLHGRLDLPDLQGIFAEFDEQPLVSISLSQRTPLPHARWVATVYHGLPESLYRFSPRHEGYLAFLGRISPEKGLDHAIEIARRAGMPLRIAAKVDRADREYFEQHIEPLLDVPGIELVGEIGEDGKGEFLGGAAALLFPVQWPEPFGLTMIEAMACGTPVIAYRRGSVPEVMIDGETGWIVDTLEEAVSAIELIEGHDRARCRLVFEERYTARRMARDYVDVYEGLMGRSLVEVDEGLAGRSA